MADLIDSYSESNRDSFAGVYNGAKTRNGNSFNCGSAINLDSAKFYLQRVGSPTGNCYAKLYSHSGTYGTSSVGNTLLATSDAVDVGSLSTSWTLTTFNFGGAERIALSASTHYVIVLEYTSGNASNYVSAGIDISSPSHGGNLCYYYSGAWTAQADRDACFYVYGSSGITQICTETIAFVDTITKTPEIVKTEVIAIVDVLNKGVSRVFTQIISIADIVVKGAGKVFSEVFSIVDLVTGLATKLKELIESISITDVLSKTTSRVFSEVVNVFDVIAKGATKIFQETIMLIEDLFKGRFLIKILTETIHFVDSIISALSHIWIPQAKPSTTFTKQSRPATLYTKQAKPSTIYTPQPRT